MSGIDYHGNDEEEEEKAVPPFKLEKFVLPTVEETVIWSELQLIVEQEWIDKLWRDTRSKLRLQRILKQSRNMYRSYTDQVLIEKLGYAAVKVKEETDEKLRAQTNLSGNRADGVCCYPCEYPFKLFGGIMHYVILCEEDIQAEIGGKAGKAGVDQFIYDRLMKCGAIEDEARDRWLYIEERKSGIFIEQRLNSQQAQAQARVPWMSDMLDPALIANIYHVFVLRWSVYFGPIAWGNVIQRPLLFDEVIHYNKTNQHHRLGRKETWMYRYHLDREARKAQKSNTGTGNSASTVPKFRGIKDKILVSEFDFPWRLNEKTNRLEAIIDGSSPTLLWGSNAYPYYFFPGIHHNLVWYLCSTEEAAAKAPAFIQENLDRIQPGLSFQHWENPPELKSIPDFNHFQVLSVDMVEYWKGIGSLVMAKQAYEWSDFASDTAIAEQRVCSRKFGRSERVCRWYHEQRRENLTRYDTEDDVILRQVFGCALRINAESRKLQAVRAPEEADAEVANTRLMENPYPYYLAENLKHLTLFCTDTNGIPERDIRRIIETETNAKSDEYVFFVDVNEQKHLQQLWYAHIIVKSNPNA
jgi:hypothetical protein